MPTPAKRLAIVPEDSSMAMIPLPGATMARAVSASCSMLILGNSGRATWPPSIAVRPRRGPRGSLGDAVGAAIAAIDPDRGYSRSHKGRSHRDCSRTDRSTRASSTKEAGGSPSECPEALRAAVFTDLQQAQGIGRAVGFHGFAAGEHDAVAGRQQAGGHQQAHGVARSLARTLAATV